jgi:DNA repair protein RecO (recombination protein O)
MRTYKTQGLIIQRRSLGEKDYAVTIFTPLYGRINAYAKGARRLKSKFTGHLDLLNICNFEIYMSPKSNIVTECQLQNNYSQFRKKLKKFYVSSNIAKMLQKFTTENENNEDIYALALNTFEALQNYDKEALIFEAFKIKLCQLLGSMPDLYELQYTDFSNIDLRLKKVLQHLLTQPYEEIIHLYLDKKDEQIIQKTVTEFMEYSL